MRIGVLTHSAGDDNYGQILQCYALQQFLKGRGHSPFLIQHEVQNLSKNESYAFIKNIIRFFLRLVSPKRRMAYRELQLIIKQRKINATRNKIRKFNKFKEKNIEMSQFYNNYETLRANPPIADAYIVGSDQVWIPSVNSQSALAWYLQFGHKEVKRISYAASIGRKLDKSEYARFKDLLDSFYAVSVREKGALENCMDAGVTKAKLVVDPTLLTTLDVYLPFIKQETPNKPYLFLYYLNVTKKEDIAWDQIEGFINENNLGVKTVSSSGYYPAFDLIPDHENLLLTIPEWLSAVYNSQYMVTTSFHGVAFAIMMHRPFVAVMLKGLYSGGNERITSLLGSLGLEKRILTEKSTIKGILSDDIDWNDVDIRLDKMRKESIEFIDTALNNS